jgi:peptide/nickel transport system ATP-binding protein
MKYRIHIASGKTTLVDCESFEFDENRITFLFGESGIGKSLMAQAVYGLLDPQRLQISVNGMVYRDYLKSPGVQRLQQNSFFVFQEPSTHLNPMMRISEQLSEGSIAAEGAQRKILAGLFDEREPAEMQQLLNVFPKPHRPSGGEKQRMLLAMAFKKIDLLLLDEIGSTPSVFIFDEPTGSLDNESRNRFLALLMERFRQRRLSILFITHDYTIIREMAHSHNPLLRYVDYRELVRIDGKQYLRKFDSRRFLDWLDSGRSLFRLPAAEERQQVLQLETGVRVFGRTINFTRQPGSSRPIPLKAHAGEMLYVKAGSGVGKTTLAKIITGLQAAENVQLQIGETEVDSKRDARFWRDEIWAKKVSMVFQHADEALNPRATVLQTLTALPLNPRPDRGAFLEHINRLFDPPVDDSFLDKKIMHLSGGQKQRINIVRTLLLDADLIILDEPLNGLDFASIRSIINLLQGQLEQGRAFMLISHNEDIFDKLIPARSVYYLTAE